MEGYSPTQKTEVKTLSFTEAVEQLIKNKRIHKLEWQDKQYFGVIVNEVLLLHKPDGKFYQWILSTGDISGDDYIVL